MHSSDDAWPTSRRANGQHHDHQNTTNPNNNLIGGQDNRTDQLFTELQRLIEHSGASTPVRDAGDNLPEFNNSHRQRAPPLFGKMPPKKSGRAMLREEGTLRHAPCITTYTPWSGAHWKDGDADRA